MRCITIVLAGILTIAARPDDKKFVVSKEEHEVIDLTNAERTAAGLAPLRANEKLFAAARGHSANMAKQDKLDHELDEKTPADRVKAAGYEFGRTGENIAWNQKTPADVLKAWMASDGHQANILNDEYTEIGVAVSANDKGERYWTQVFGKPLK